MLAPSRRSFTVDVRLSRAPRGLRLRTIACEIQPMLCGTAAEITPVSEIGDDRFTPADLSLSLMDEYSRLVRGQI